MSDSVRSHKQQSTKHLHPWDSPGKNTGVSCHFLLQCMKVKSESEVAQSCPTLSDPMDCSPPGSSIHGIFQARVLEWGAIAFSHMLVDKYAKHKLRSGGKTVPIGYSFLGKVNESFPQVSARQVVLGAFIDGAPEHCPQLPLAPAKATTSLRVLGGPEGTAHFLFQ